MTDFSLDIKPESPIHKRLLEALNARFRLSGDRMLRLHDRWRKSEDQFLAFLPERDIDQKRRQEREVGGKPQYTTIVLPYTYAMLMSAHSYWTTVFLSRDPIFQYAGRHGESQQKTQAVEALIAYQVQVGEMLLPFYFWLLDAGKYGLGVLGNYWCEESTSVSRYIEVPQTLYGMPIGGEPKKQLVTEQVKGYHGSKIFNVRPYDFYPDTRIPLHAVQRGEFVAYQSEVGWHEILDRANAGNIVNSKELLKKSYASYNTGRSSDGSSQIELPNDNLSNVVYNEGDLQKTGPYGLITMYVNLVPREWGLSSVGTSEKWVFTAATTGASASQGAARVSMMSLILEARPLGAAHNKFPVSVLEMEPEAYGLSSRGMPEVMKPLQDGMDWLFNSHMYNVRKTMNNQFVVDPSRIVMQDFVDPMAGGAIRAKPSAYGTDVKQAITQLPVTDMTRNHINDIGFMHEFAQRALGVNDQIMGLLQSGGRKTAQEVRASSTFGVNRQKTISEFYSAMGFAPLSQMLVQNSQQYFDAPMKLKIVGDLIQEAGPGFIDVTPDDIAGMFDFVPVDGTMPIDRYAQANLWQQMLMNVAKMPQVFQQYDIGRIFAWVAGLAGLHNMNRFKIQILPPGANPNLAGQGNVIPMPGRAPTAPGTVPEPGQVPNMGATG